MNIRSLRANFLSLELHLKATGKHYDIIALSESWVKESEGYKFKLDGYSLTIQERVSKLSGGVALYIREDWLNKVEPIISEHMNGLIFNFTAFDHVPTTGVLVYRFCRGHVNNFITELEELSSSFSERCFIFGDANIDILKVGESCSNYLSTLASMGFVSAINFPTRITSISSTCIDHFHFRNVLGTTELDTNKLISTNSHQVPFSDHSLIEVTISIPAVPPKLGHETYRLTDWEKVKQKISCTDWDFLALETDLNRKYQKFVCKITSTIESETVTKKTNPRLKKRAPWASRKLAQLTVDQKNIFKTSRRFPDNPEWKAALKRIQKQIKVQAKLDKKQFYDAEFERHRHDPKKYWAVIKKAISNGRPKISEIRICDSCVTVEGNEQRVADTFNRFFTDTIKNLTLKYGSFDSDHNIGLGTRTIESCFVAETTPFEIQTIISKLPNTSSVGDDGIPTGFVKQNAEALSAPLALLFNESLSTGIFPDLFKKAVVVPLFKSGDRLDISNYRPISLLSVFSKILEKLVHSRLMKFLEKISFFF